MVRLIPLDRHNWEECLGIRLRPDQEDMVPSILYSLAQARFEHLYPYGIYFEGRVAGFAMYGEFGGICWINRIIIDAAQQGKGIGREALRQMIAMLQGNAHCREIRTSCAHSNTAARRFFEAAGFVALEAAMPEEVVLRFGK